MNKCKIDTNLIVDLFQKSLHTKSNKYYYSIKRKILIQQDIVTYQFLRNSDTLKFIKISRLNERCSMKKTKFTLCRYLYLTICKINSTILGLKRMRKMRKKKKIKDKREALTLVLWLRKRVASCSADVLLYIRMYQSEHDNHAKPNFDSPQSLHLIYLRYIL